MKTQLFLSALIFGLSISAATAQSENDTDQPVLPGDNFSLEGALDLFKKASSPEEFEKLLNSGDAKVNNLDLNEDGSTDYIRVINRREEGVQIFVLQAVISENENQDIAVIEVEKTGNETAVIEISGDEDLYGEERIVEPSDDASTGLYSTGIEQDELFRFSAATNHGPKITALDLPRTIIVNVWAWPSVRFIYAPGYKPWISPFSWAARPVWWRPWRPLSWSAYRPYRYHYKTRYVVAPVRRITRASVIYRPVRVTSVTVRNRNQVNINRYRATGNSRKTTVSRSGNQYKATRKKTTITGPRGNKVSRTKTTFRKKR